MEKVIGELIKKHQEREEYYYNLYKNVDGYLRNRDLALAYQKIVEDLTTLLNDIHHCPEKGDDDVDYIEELEAKQEDEDGNPLPF